MAAEWAIRKLSEIAFWAEAALEYEWEHNTAYFIDRVACLGLVSCQLRPGVARSPRMSARGEANQRLLSGDLPSNFDSMSTASAPMVDTSGDAELARRLQMEEQGAGNQVRRAQRKRRKQSPMTFTAYIPCSQYPMSPNSQELAQRSVAHPPGAHLPYLTFGFCREMLAPILCSRQWQIRHKPRCNQITPNALYVALLMKVVLGLH